MSDRVSCLMPTTTRRVGLVQRAMMCFTEQSHKDKELLVGLTHAPTIDLLRQFALGLDAAIHVMDVSKDPMFRRDFLTTLKVLTQASTGDWLTLWDDDNLYHPMRLERQLADSTVLRPSVFAEGIYHFFDTKEVFLVNPDHRGNPLPRRVIPYTLMTHRKAWKGWIKSEVEHPNISVLRRIRDRQEPLMIIRDEFKWVVVGVRRDNLRGYGLHRLIAASESESWRSERLMRGRSAVEDALDAYVWPDDNVTVCGSDGAAFVYQPMRTWSADLLPIGKPLDDVERIDETES